MFTMRRLAVTRHLARVKGRFEASARWFAPMDAAEHLLKYRHTRMLLVDTAILMQNANPFRHNVVFGDVLADVFGKENKHSLQVASHVLRDERMFQVFLISRAQRNNSKIVS
jgi:hypothetical protein